MNTYRTLGTYTNHTCSFHTNEQECSSEVAASLGKSLFGKALLCTVSVVKAGLMFKMKPLQVVYKER